MKNKLELEQIVPEITVKKKTLKSKKKTIELSIDENEFHNGDVYNDIMEIFNMVEEEMIELFTNSTKTKG